MLVTVRLLEGFWIALSMKDFPQLCNWQSTWRMAKGYTSLKQQSNKELMQSHHRLHLQTTYTLCT
jgi:hypothetical protein